MTKEQFVSIMKEFVSRREDYMEWIDAVDNVLGGGWEKIMSNSFEDFVPRILKEVLNDTDDWINYFVYERNCHWFSYFPSYGNSVLIDNYEKLYDLITKGSI